MRAKEKLRARKKANAPCVFLDKFGKNFARAPSCAHSKPSFHHNRKWRALRGRIRKLFLKYFFIGIVSNGICRVWKVCPLHALFLARILWKCFQKLHINVIGARALNLPFVWIPNEKVFQEKLSYSTMEYTPSLECAPLFWCDETRALNARKMARRRSFPKLVKENTWVFAFFFRAHFFFGAHDTSILAVSCGWREKSALI